MPMFPISDPTREDDIRTRRRRAGLLLAVVFVVPWMMFHRDHADDRRQASSSLDDDQSMGSDRIPQGALSGVLANIPAGGRLRWSITGAGLPQPMPDAPARRFSARRLTVDLSCANSVTLLPKQDLDDEVIVSVRPDQGQALQTLAVRDGVVEQQEACDEAHKADFIVQSAPAKALTIRQEGALDIRGGRFSGNVTVEASGSGEVILDGAGTLTDNQHASGNVTIGEVSGNIVARLLGSGGLTVNGGEVAHLSVESRASGDVSMRQTRLRDTTVALSGSGDFIADRVVGRFDASTSASGDITVASMSADIVRLQGDESGDIIIRGGHIGTLSATRRGSGDLAVRAVIDNGTVFHDGDGDVTVPHASGAVVRTGRQDERDDD